MSEESGEPEESEEWITDEAIEHSRRQYEHLVEIGVIDPEE